MPEDKPILTPEEAKERIRKTREDRLPKPEDIVQDSNQEQKIPNPELPSYPFTDAEKQKKKPKAEPQPTPVIDD
jgi:hypothetical protein